MQLSRANAFDKAAAYLRQHHLLPPEATGPASTSAPAQQASGITESGAEDGSTGTLAGSSSDQQQQLTAEQLEERRQSAATASTSSHSSAHNAIGSSGTSSSSRPGGRDVAMGHWRLSRQCTACSAEQPCDVCSYTTWRNMEVRPLSSGAGC